MKNIRKSFIFGIILNISFIIIEIIYGFKSNSLALLSDAFHNVSDVAGLIIAMIADVLSRQKASKNYTYGMQGLTIFAALINAILLILAVIFIIYEAFSRLFIESFEINSPEVIIVALIGIVINGVTAYLFLLDLKKNKREDLNIKGAYLHMFYDALVSFGVVFAGILIYFTGYFLIDQITSFFIALMILFGTWNLLKDSVKMSLGGVPSHINFNKVEDFLSDLENVKEVHDLHIWSISTMDIALSVHILMKNYPPEDFIFEVQKKLQEKFQISHSTIQIEIGENSNKCQMASQHPHLH